MFLGEPPTTAYDLRFQVSGIPVRVHPLFWLIAVLLGLRGATGPDAGILLLIWVLVVLVSIIVHEMGHAIAMRYFGLTPRIVLYMMGGLAIADRFTSVNYGKGSGNQTRNQILISLAGPAAGFLLAAVTVGAFTLVGGEINLLRFIRFEGQYIRLPEGSNNLLAYLVNDLLYVNIFWGLINLLPVYPLDGGQVSREICLKFDPWNGVIRSLWISVFAGGAVAVMGLVYWNEIFLMLMFASLAVSSYMAIQQMGGGGGFGGGYGGGGFGGGGRRPW